MMKFALPMTMLAVLSACMTAPMATETDAVATQSAGQKIETFAQFQEIIVGKTMDFNGNTFQFKRDGTLSGPWDGSGIDGTWTWDNGASCRTATIGSRVLEPDCQTWVVDGANATVTRDRGAGGSFVYVIK